MPSGSASRGRPFPSGRPASPCRTPASSCPLANALGVSLDWLLSEDGPGEAAAASPGRGTDGAGSTARAQAFRRGVKRWCWLAGVLLAVCGAYFIYQAAIAKLAVSGLLNLINIDGGLTGTTVLVNGVDTPIGDLRRTTPCRPSRRSGWS